MAPPDYQTTRDDRSHRRTYPQYPPNARDNRDFSPNQPTYLARFTPEILHGLPTYRLDFMDDNNRPGGFRIPDISAFPAPAMSSHASPSPNNAVVHPAACPSTFVEEALRHLHHELEQAETFFRDCQKSWQTTTGTFRSNCEGLLKDETLNAMWDAQVQVKAKDARFGIRFHTQIEKCLRESTAAIEFGNFIIRPTDTLKEQRRRRMVERINTACAAIMGLAEAALTDQKSCTMLLKEIGEVKKDMDPSRGKNKELYGEEDKGGKTKANNGGGGGGSGGNGGDDNGGGDNGGNDGNGGGNDGEWSNN